MNYLKLTFVRCEIILYYNSNLPNLANEVAQKLNTTASEISIIASHLFCSDPLDIYTTQYQHLLGCGDLDFWPFSERCHLFCPLLFLHFLPGISHFSSFSKPLLSECIVFSGQLFAHVWEDMVNFGHCVPIVTF